MSYVFLPPRTSNYFPPGPPYLAGLGDYAADLAAYNKDYETWLQEKASYERSMSYYNGTVSSNEKNYQAAKAKYDADKAAWDREAAAYNAAMVTYQSQLSAQWAANAAAVKTLTMQRQATFDPWVYNQGGCITAAQQQYYRSNCKVLKGIGAAAAGSDYGSSGNCWYAKLPVCSFPAKPTLRAQPVPPVRAANPTPPTLRPEPRKPVPPPPVTCWDGSTVASASACPPKQQCWNGSFVRDLSQCPPKPAPPPPAVPSPPSSTPTPTPSSPPPAVDDSDDPSKRGMIMNGLILVAIATGGYLVYRTLKKPKAAA